MALGIVTLGLYLLGGVLSVVRPGPYLPPWWAYLPGVALAVFVGYRLVRGRTYQLGQYTAFVVLALTVITVVVPVGRLRALDPQLQLPPPEYYVITGLPILGFLAVYLARTVSRKRGSTPTHSDR